MEEGAVHHAHPASNSDHEAHDENHSITHQMMILVLQLALIVLVARLCGEIFERFLKQPAVLGELAAGMLIGPYALGPYISVLGSGPLFPLLEGAPLPVSVPLYGVATIASIILLFMVGLETNFQQFMRYAGPGAAVGVGGVLGSFITGALLYSWFSGKAFMDPASLFMGTVSTATSVGITARVLSEKKKLDSAEGTTILAGAVIDDVLGILLLAVVGGLAASQSGSGSSEVDWMNIGIIAAKAFGFWIIATLLGITFSSRIAQTMLWFRTAGAQATLGMGMALLIAGIAETFGLAMIIGAYIMGLSLSKEKIAHLLERSFLPLYACFVPIFFAVMGMLVNFKAMGEALFFGLIYTLVAIFSKVVFSGLPCLFVGFNFLGASRIGMGMLPRGEVALIVAGVGMSQSFIGQDMFGVVIMMTLVTTVIAPPGLVKLFSIAKEGSKIAAAEEEKVKALALPEKMISIDSLTWTNHDMLITCIRNSFESRAFSFNVVSQDESIFQINGTHEEENVSVTLRDFNSKIQLKTSSKHHEFVKERVKDAHEDAKRRITSLTIKEEAFQS